MDCRAGKTAGKYLLALMYVTVASMASSQNSSPAKQRAEAVQSHLSRYVILRDARNDELELFTQMKALRVPAVSIAAIRGGRIDWARAYGVTSIDGAPATTETLFGAASISKPVTAFGVMKLVEDGKIDLDADVNRYLKRWKVPDSQFTEKQKVTVRQLLNHTSGIGTHNGIIYNPSVALPTLPEMLNGAKPARTPAVVVEAVPGTKFAYSNGGYLVLYLLIEDVTGESFASFMKHTVLDPIGMKNSSFDAPLSPERADQAATSYTEGGTATSPAKFVEPNLAAGGLWTTPRDLAKFLIEVQREYTGKSHKILHQQTIQMMLVSGTSPAPARRWGMGFEVGGVQTISMSGMEVRLISRTTWSLTCEVQALLS